MEFTEVFLNLEKLMIELIFKKLEQKTPVCKVDIYGIDKIQPIWADHYFKTISNAKWD